MPVSLLMPFRTRFACANNPARGCDRSGYGLLMSMEVPVDTLQSVASDYGPTAYAVVSDPTGGPRITHVMPNFAGGSITIGVGRRSISLLEQHGQLGLLWPATPDQTMSLIVDAEVDQFLEDGQVRVTPTSAVRHRPAPQPD